MSTSNIRKRNRIQLYSLVAILVGASICYRVIAGVGLEQTSILFIGLPAFITLLTIKYTRTPKSVYGLVFKVMTLFFLMAAIILGEGFICILIAAPLFYSLAALIIFIIQYLNKNKDSDLQLIVLVPVLLILGQPQNVSRLPDLQTVHTTTRVDSSVSFESFTHSPNFLEDYPTFFKMGFPKPVGIAGDGVKAGDIRHIKFKSRTKGIGTLSLIIVQANNSKIVFGPLEDDTHINHWLTWKQITIELKRIEGSQTEISWTTQYTCDLGPAWYFEPIERLAVRIMNQHLIDAYF